MAPRKSFSMLIRELSENYYNHVISFEEYRQKRGMIFDQIDVHFNGAQINEFQKTSDQANGSRSADGITDRFVGDTSEANTLGGTQAFSVKEVLDAQDKKN